MKLFIAQLDYPKPKSAQSDLAHASPGADGKLQLIRRKSRVEVAVPTHSNTLVAFPDALFSRFETFLCYRAGGWTREGNIHGGWMSSSRTIVSEGHRKYFIITPPAAASDTAAEIAAYVCREFEQEAVLVTISEIDTTI